MVKLAPRRDWTSDMGEHNNHMPLSGVDALSPMAKSLLVRTGQALAGVKVEDLGTTYAITLVRDGLSDDLSEVDCSEAIETLLPHFYRLSRQGLTLPQVAARLGLPLGVLREGALLMPSRIGASITGGLAAGIDNVTGALIDKAMTGEPRLVKLFVEAKAGEDWSPKPIQPAINIGIGNALSAVSLDPVDSLRANQAALLLDVDYSEL